VDGTNDFFKKHFFFSRYTEIILELANLEPKTATGIIFNTFHEKSFHAHKKKKIFFDIQIFLTNWGIFLGGDQVISTFSGSH